MLKCKSLFVKLYITHIIQSWKYKQKQTFAILCLFIVNKLCATDSNISPDEKKK